MKIKVYTSVYLNLYLLLLVFCSSCSRFIEVEPPITSTNGENVFKEDASAIAVLTSIYANMSNAGANDEIGRITNVFFFTGLTGDELIPWDENNMPYETYYNNNILTTVNTWANVYNMIFIANSAIEGLPKGTSLTPSVKNQLLGEAKFIRALCYFYLVNLYGGVPLALSTDYKVNQLLPRSNEATIYDQIKLDLKEAQLLLNDNYTAKDGVSRTDERIRPNKWTATALLARVYLYTKNYSAAEDQSTSLINNSLYKLVDLNSAFLMNNYEAIWQLQPVGAASNNSANTKEGQILNLSSISSDGGNPIVYLSNELLNSFDSKDQRRSKWINTIKINGVVYPYSCKYKIGLESAPTQEYSTVFRLSEQYLIRAESRIQQGNISLGVSDLNIIRKRATNLSDPVSEQFSQLPLSLDKDNALLAVEQERRHELFTEYGHRWFDIKRTSRINAILSVLKGANWQSTDQLFPIPEPEIGLNPSLRGHQNSGY